MNSQLLKHRSYHIFSYEIITISSTHYTQYTLHAIQDISVQVPKKINEALNFTANCSIEITMTMHYTPTSMAKWIKTKISQIMQGCGWTGILMLLMEISTGVQSFCKTVSITYWRWTYMHLTILQPTSLVYSLPLHVDDVMFKIIQNWTICGSQHEDLEQKSKLSCGIHKLGTI